MENGKSEEESNVWQELQIPQIGYPKFISCTTREIASYSVEALSSSKSPDTKISVIFSSEDSKKMTYTTMRKMVSEQKLDGGIIRANPQEIVVRDMGCVNLYRPPLTPKNRDMMMQSTVVIIQLDSLRWDSVQALATDEAPNSPLIIYYNASSKEYKDSLPPAVTRATRAIEYISYALKIMLGLVVCVYVLVISTRFLLRLGR